MTTIDLTWNSTLLYPAPDSTLQKGRFPFVQEAAFSLSSACQAIF